jgi:hypothetical protein
LPFWHIPKKGYAIEAARNSMKENMVQVKENTMRVKESKKDV